MVINNKKFIAGGRYILAIPIQLNPTVISTVCLKVINFKAILHATIIVIKTKMRLKMPSKYSRGSSLIMPNQPLYVMRNKPNTL